MEQNVCEDGISFRDRLPLVYADDYFRVCVDQLFGTLSAENLRVHANDYVNGMEIPFEEFCFVLRKMFLIIIFFFFVCVYVWL
jgi:hypothetical protein